MRFNKNLLLTIILLLVINISFSQNKPKYIFYFIGDGFGLTQATASEAYKAALNNEKGISKLTLSTFPSQGFFTTHAQDRFITGSAAGGTALSTGHKTTINTIGLSGDHQNKLTSIAEIAKQKGYKVGIVSSVSIDHATPAAFYAHQKSRSMYYEISLDLSKSGFNYFAGGSFANPEGVSKVSDKANMGRENINEHGNQTNSYEIAKKRGYKIINTKKDFRKLKKGDDKIIAYSPVLAGGHSLRWAIDQDKSDISLDSFTKKGIELLNNSNGFFMMVEGGKIDWACHANDAATAINEVLQFDNAVNVAYEFYKKHPKETLIIVVGDHETGGMALGFAGTKYENAFELLKHQKVSYETFEDILAKYKNENKLTFEKTLKLLKKYYGLGDVDKRLGLSDYELNRIKKAYEQSMHNKKTSIYKDENYKLYGGYDPITITATHILSSKAGIGWTTFSHTGAPIPIRAIGVGHENFKGFYDNTDVFKKLNSLIK